MNCTNCGNPINPGDAFCSNCGVPVSGSVSDNKSYQAGAELSSPTYSPVPAAAYSVDPQKAFTTLAGKIRTSCTIWTVIGIYQIVIGVFLLFFGYGLLSLILGIWNLVQSSKNRKTAAAFLTNPVGIVDYYESSKSSTIIGIIINLVFGAVFGVFGSLYELSVDNYVLSHRDAFKALENR